MATTTAATSSGQGRRPGKLILSGTLLIILGVLFMVVPKAMGSGSATYLGLLLAATGLVEALSGRRGEPEQHRSLLVGGGALWFVVGLLVLARPTASVGVIPLLFVVLLLASGFQAVWLSAADRYPGWRWDCLFGAAAVLFGIAMAGRWPSVALWLPGSLVGIAVIVRGATMLVGGLEHHARPRSIQRA
ncbi:MAG TPA: DUF308 domain-containing protein [Polyangia bacterium]|nr:DUF308 domain-containing protein [Polyangia bacterium]